jgi:hypothetical protein
MMGKKKLAEIKAEVAALLARLPAPAGQAWLKREIQAGRGNKSRDVETLEMLCSALEREVTKSKKPKTQRPRLRTTPKPARRN